MKKIKWVIGLFIIAIIIKFLFNKTKHIWTYNTSSIEESKTKGSFVYQYEIVDISLNERKDSNMINNLVIWKEEQLTTEPFLIFFHPYRSNGEYSLILKSEVFTGEPTLYARLKGNGTSGNQKRTHVVITEQEIKPIEEIILYYDNINELGSIKIRAME